MTPYQITISRILPETIIEHALLTYENQYLKRALKCKKNGKGQRRNIDFANQCREVLDQIAAANK